MTAKILEFPPRSMTNKRTLTKAEKLLTLARLSLELAEARGRLALAEFIRARGS